MNIVFDKKEFAEAVGITARFSERRTATLPVLSAIIVVAGDDGIKLRATNLETGIDMALRGTIRSPGVVALPAHILKDIALSFSGTGALSFEHVGDTVTFSSGTAKSVAKTVPYEDFPTIPLPESSAVRLTLPGALLRDAIGAVVSCASSSSVRPELASVLLLASGGKIKAVATDSFRLAEKQISLEKGIPAFTALIPAKNASEIAATIPENEVTVSFDEHQGSFSWDGSTLSTRLTAAQYPDYAQIIPKSFTAEATVLRKDFEAALRRAAVFSDAFQKVRLSFEIKGKRITISSRNTDTGESVESVPASVSGDPLELPFNHRYLQAPLPLISAESIKISAAGIGRPLLIRGAGDASFLYLVMPMNQ